MPSPPAARFGGSPSIIRLEGRFALEARDASVIRQCQVSGDAMPAPMRRWQPAPQRSARRSPQSLLQSDWRGSSPRLQRPKPLPASSACRLIRCVERQEIGLARNVVDECHDCIDLLRSLRIGRDQHPAGGPATPHLRLEGFRGAPRNLPVWARRVASSTRIKVLWRLFSGPLAVLGEEPSA